MKISLAIVFSSLFASSTWAQVDSLDVPTEVARVACKKLALEIGQKVSKLNVATVRSRSLKAELMEEREEYRDRYVADYRVTMSGAEDTTVFVTVKERSGEVESPCIVDSLKYQAD